MTLIKKKKIDTFLTEKSERGNSEEVRLGAELAGPTGVIRHWCIRNVSEFVTVKKGL